MPATVERVDKLEKVLADYIVTVGNAQARTEAELRAFKDEMKVFKDEMKDFKDEMKGFKDEMKGYKDENKEIIRDMNKKWGEMANKLGTIAEDLVYPSIPRIVQEEFGLDVWDLRVRWKRKFEGGRVKEYDAVGVAGDYVFINSTKSSPQNRDVDELLAEISSFREFFPEYKTKKIIGMIAGLSVEESVLWYAEKEGFMVLATGDELMEVKNAGGFRPREF